MPSVENLERILEHKKKAMRELQIEVATLKEQIAYLKDPNYLKPPKRTHIPLRRPTPKPVPLKKQPLKKQPKKKPPKKKPTKTH